MSDNYLKRLERNIPLYYVFKIFTKRVYLPLIALFLVNDAQLTLAEIAVIASITTIAQMFLDLPTGYIADRWGHKKAIALGTFAASLSPLAYLAFPNFSGGLAASLLFFGGWSFVSGAAQAFIHDTLKVLNRAHEYSKLMGRAQGFGLLGNVLLITIVPLTWGIDHRLPFLIGFFSTFTTFILALCFTIPRVEHDIAKKRTSLLTTLREIPVPYLLFTLMMYGIVAAAFDFGPQYRELVFTNLGIPTAYFGFILALGSSAAAIAGRFIHLLDKIRPSSFYLFDALFMVAVFVAIGSFTNPILSILAFMLLPAYDRNRAIIAESHMLARYPDHHHKATLVSVLDFYPRLNGIWVPLAFAAITGAFGLQSGYAVFGLILLPVLLLLYVTYRLTTSGK